MWPLCLGRHSGDRCTLPVRTISVFDDRGLLLVWEYEYCIYVLVGEQRRA